jgi:hypothetical protein
MSNRQVCDRCEKVIDVPFHYIPRNGKYYFCSDECLLADYRGQPLESAVADDNFSSAPSKGTVSK